MTIKTRLQQIHQRIHIAEKKANRTENSVRLIAVSKKHSTESIQQAIRAGQVDFGENYLQEALEKIQTLSNKALVWHFIGPIQSNKTKAIAENFSWVHSVDRLKIAQRLSEQRPAHLPALNICLQVNLNREASKSGVYLEDLPKLVATVDQLPHLTLRGLMAIPEASNDMAQQTQNFERLREALETLQENYPHLDTLSMGMSRDLEAAIAAGTTMVRVGTAIFGART